MNFSIYLPDHLAQKINLTVEVLNITRNHAICEAIEEWLNKQQYKEWSENLFDFEAIKDVPNFSSYRKELLPPSENIL